MNSASAFQQQYPLSKKKFWKKMITKAMSIVSLSVGLGVVVGLLIGLLVLVQNPQADNTIFIWIPIVTTLACAIFGFLIYGVYIKDYILRYYYDAAEHFITIQKGVFAPTEIHVPYGKIQDVYVDQDVLDRIMGIYDVHIASATQSSSIEAHIDGVDPHIAEQLKNFLLNKIQYGGSSQTPSMEMSTVAAPPTHAPAAPMNVTAPQAGVFNTKHYPISSSWLVTSLLTVFWSSGIYTFLIWSFLVGRRSSARIYDPNAVQILLTYAVLFIGQVIWNALWRSTFFFELQAQFILVKDGVVKREEKHVPYRTLQNVLLKRSMVERLFGLSTVVIENAAMGSSKTGRASRITIPGQPLDKGTELVAELNRILGQGMNGHGTGL